jgi:hypothetical protein
MAEAITVLCLFFSMSIFLAHALDAFAPSVYRKTDSPDS